MTRVLPLIVASISIALMVPLHGILKKTMSERSRQEKLGYVPSARVLKVAALDHKPTLGQWLFFKVLTYYGGKIDPVMDSRKGIEYYNMFRFINAATYLDPYNIDAYYFAEAVFTWGLNRIKEVNYLLERALKFRTWDHYIPFFLGFNHFYFLKDNKKAAEYLKIASRMTKSQLFANLAARLLYEASETESAVQFLEKMIRQVPKGSVRMSLEIRLKALKAVAYLENAVKQYRERFQTTPTSLDELVKTGIIIQIPEDPYGGRFYIDQKGRIRSTSKFAFIKKQ